MGLLGKLFGGGATVIRLRQLVEQQRYVDARLLAEQLAGQSLTADDAVEVETLRIRAGDGLAQLNLDEALGLQRGDDFERARDHLQLAQEQVCSAALREVIERAIAVASSELEHLEVMEDSPACACATSQPTDLPYSATDGADDDTQLELILTAYPPVVAARYAAKSETFKAAFLLANAGEDDAALTFWQQVEDAEQDDLYWFELGSLQARRGELQLARTALITALEQNPELLLAIEALIEILIGDADYDSAQQYLQQFLERGIDPAFCHAQLMTIYVRQREYPAAAEHARQALAAGNSELGFVLSAASVLEHIGALGETEQALQLIRASRGGSSLPLAEFWLRQKSQLAVILDIFNDACREEPDNPRWQLRVAQTYIARNWVKDGVKLLRKVVDDPRLEPELTREAAELLSESGSA